MKNRWIIALISTDYDLKSERQAIISLLKDHNIDVHAFEESSFPQFTQTHSHDNCLKALDRVDAAILLVNSRYGGEYYLDKDLSITEKEFLSLKVPTLVFVNHDVWQERSVYRKQQKVSGKSEEDFIKENTYSPSHVQDVRVFRFLDEIQNRYSDERSNWMNFWSDLEDLKSKIPNALRALSIEWMHKIVEKQINEIRSRKTSTALSMSLGEVLKKGYYIEPNYPDNPTSTITFSDAVNKELKEEKSVLILGEAGAGKTTLLAKSFLEEADNISKHAFHIPFYIQLKGKDIKSPFSIDFFLQESCEKYFHKERYPFFKYSDFKFTFYLDGFDELAEKLSTESLHTIYSSEIFQWPVMLTSRSQYAERFMSSSTFTSKFGFIERLPEWTPDIAKQYISHFCRLQGKDQKFEDKIYSLLINNADLQNILNSPLMVTILLYVIEHCRMNAPETITSRVQLFEECINHLARREIESKYSTVSSPPSENELVLHWAYFAWIIIEQRMNNKPSVIIADTVQTIKTKYNQECQTEWLENCYDVIFDTNGTEAFGTFHEQFLEYLVAYALVHACLNKKKPYPIFFKYVMRPEINRYFRGIAARKSYDEQQTLFNNICDLYWQCIGKNDNDTIFMRVHTVYHLSRLSAKDAAEQIERIFAVEKNQAVLQSLFFGVIKKGELNREEELYRLLCNDSSYSDSNRGYHLAYYDNIGIQKELPYKDDNTIKWIGTLRAFKKHFNSNNIEHYYLRRVDLVTMWQLMEYRNDINPLKDDDLHFFQERVKKYPEGSNSEYQELVEKEFDKLKQVFERLKNTKSET